MPSEILLGVRILIVEDVAATRRLIARLLGSLGCHDLIEADGVEGAWQHLNRQRIDLMLLDYELLDGTGIKLMQELRANSASCPAAKAISSGRRDVVPRRKCSGSRPGWRGLPLLCVVEYVGFDHGVQPGFKEVTQHRCAEQVVCRR